MLSRNQSSRKTWKVSQTNNIVISPRVEPLTLEIDSLQGISTTIISDSLGRHSVGKQILPINKKPVYVCANAFTVEVRAGDNLMVFKALKMIQPGDALVIAGEGDIDRALIGEILMTVAKKRGVAAVIVDGAIRDVDAFDRESFPCWAKGISLRGPFKEGPGTINQPVRIGGMLVHPGDIIIGDSDGVVVVPRELATDAIHLGRANTLNEEKVIASIWNGTYDDSWVDRALEQKGAYYTQDDDDDCDL